MQDKKREEQVRDGVCRQTECIRPYERVVCECVYLCVLPIPDCSLTKDRGANLDGRRQDVEKAGREYSQLKLQRDELSNERKSVRRGGEGGVVLQ